MSGDPTAHSCHNLQKSTCRVFLEESDALLGDSSSLRNVRNVDERTGMLGVCDPSKHVTFRTSTMAAFCLASTSASSTAAVTSVTIILRILSDFHESGPQGWGHSLSVEPLDLGIAEVDISLQDQRLSSNSV